MAPLQLVVIVVEMIMGDFIMRDMITVMGIIITIITMVDIITVGTMEVVVTMVAVVETVAVAIDLLCIY